MSALTWVRDDHQPIVCLSKTGIDYFIGDFLYMDVADNNTVKPAGSFTWNTNLATTQPLFKAVFTGICNMRILAAQTGRNVVVSTAGVFRYPCAALGAALAQGAFLGPDKAAGNNLLPQQLVSVANKSLAIAQLVENAPVGATSLLVRPQSTLQDGGVQGVV